MELNNLRPAPGSVKGSKRIGRGQGSGKGGTSTKGHKGAKSRSGFKNVNRVEYVAINTGMLQAISDKYNVSEINKEALVKLGIVSENDNIKILASGDLTAKLTVKSPKISAAAVEKIQAAGGSVVTE